MGVTDRFCLACGQALAEVSPAAAGGAVDPDVPLRVDLGEDPTDLSMPVPDATHAIDVDLVACPRCGASNAARRARCGRCGTLLQASARGAEPAPSPDEVVIVTPAPVLPPPAPAPRRRGLGLLVVVLGLVVGTGLGVLAGLGVGPFARPATVAFDPLAYPDPASLRRPDTAGASSTAAADGARTFGPERAVDGDLATAWRASGQGEGELVRHGFVRPQWVDRIEVATGDQVDDGTFLAHGRVTRVEVDLGTQRLDVTLADGPGVQVVALPEPVLTDEITWTLRGVAGTPAALSEIRYVGWPADDDDTAAFRDH